MSKITQNPRVQVPRDEPRERPPGRDKDDSTARPKEIGGRKGPDPTRFGDWEKNGRCIDF